MALRAISSFTLEVGSQLGGIHVDKNTFVTRHGNAVVFYEVEDGGANAEPSRSTAPVTTEVLSTAYEVGSPVNLKLKNTLSFAAGYVLDCLAFNRHTRLLAVCLHGLTTEVRFYQWPSLRCVGSTTSDELSIDRIALSADCSRMATITIQGGGRDAPALTCWSVNITAKAGSSHSDMHDSQADASAGVSVECRVVTQCILGQPPHRHTESSQLDPDAPGWWGHQPILFMEFNPLNPLQFAVGHAKGLAVYTCISKYTVNMHWQDVGLRIGNGQDADADDPSRQLSLFLLSYCWSGQTLYCGTSDGQVLSLDGPTIAEIAKSQPQLDTTDEAVAEENKVLWRPVAAVHSTAELAAERLDLHSGGSGRSSGGSHRKHHSSSSSRRAPPSRGSSKRGGAGSSHHHHHHHRGPTVHEAFEDKAITALMPANRLLVLGFKDGCIAWLHTSSGRISYRTYPLRSLALVDATHHQPTEVAPSTLPPSLGHAVRTIVPDATFSSLYMYIASGVDSSIHLVRAAVVGPLPTESSKSSRHRRRAPSASPTSTAADAKSPPRATAGDVNDDDEKIKSVFRLHQVSTFMQPSTTEDTDVPSDLGVQSVWMAKLPRSGCGVSTADGPVSGVTAANVVTVCGTVLHLWRCGEMKRSGSTRASPTPDTSHGDTDAVTRTWCGSLRLPEPQGASAGPHRFQITSWAMYNSAQLCVFGLSNGVVGIIDVTTPHKPRLVFCQALHAVAVHKVSFSPNGRYIASAALDTSMVFVYVRPTFSAGGAMFAVLGWYQYSLQVQEKRLKARKADLEAKAVEKPRRRVNARVRRRGSITAVWEKERLRSENMKKSMTAMAKELANPIAITDTTWVMLSTADIDAQDDEKLGSDDTANPPRPVLLVALSDKTVVSLTAPPTPAASTKDEFTNLQDVVRPVVNDVPSKPLALSALRIDEENDMSAPSGGHGVRVLVAFANKDLHVYTVFADCKLQVEEKLESGHFMSPKCICVSSNGSLVATGGADGQVIVRDTNTMRICAQTALHRLSIRSPVAVVAGDAKKEYHLGLCLEEPKESPKSKTKKSARDSAGKRRSAGRERRPRSRTSSVDAAADVEEKEKAPSDVGVEEDTPPQHKLHVISNSSSGGVQALAFSSDGKLLFSAGADGSVLALDVSEFAGAVQAGMAALASLAVSPMRSASRKSIVAQPAATNAVSGQALKKLVSLPLHSLTNARDPPYTHERLSWISRLKATRDAIRRALTDLSKTRITPEAAARAVADAKAGIKASVGSVDAPQSSTDTAGVALPDHAVAYIAGRRRTIQERAKRIPTASNGQQLQAVLSEFQQHLQDLLDQNERAPALEQLKREEFAVDMEMQSHLQQLFQSKALQVRDRINKDNLRRQYLRHRILRECWDSVEVHQRRFSGFRNLESVSSFSLRTITHRERVNFRRVIGLRRIEVLETANVAQQLAGGMAPTDEPDASMSLLDNSPELMAHWESLKTTMEFYTSKALSGKSAYVVLVEDFVKRTTNAHSDDKKTHKEDDEEDPLLVALAQHKLLYHPMELVTMSRKRTQAVLLQLYCRIVRSQFNHEWKVLYADKQRQLQVLRDKVAGMQAIQAELQWPLERIERDIPPSLRHLAISEEERVKQQTLAGQVGASGGAHGAMSSGMPRSLDEHPELVLTVRDDEITAEKPVNPNDSDAHAGRQPKDAEAARRGLQDMMNGTLYTKKETTLALLEKELIKKDWMSTLPKEKMTEEQLKELAQYEQRLKVVQEERMTRQRMLETDYAKFRNDVNESVRNFDSRFASLLRKRRETMEQLYLLELIIIKLNNDVADYHDATKAIRELDTKIDDVAEQVHDAESRARAFADQVSDVEQQLAGIVQEQRAQDKRFRSEFRDMLRNQVAAPLSDMSRSEDSDMSRAISNRPNTPTGLPGMPAQPRVNLAKSALNALLDRLQRLYQSRQPYMTQRPSTAISTKSRTSRAAEDSTHQVGDTGASDAKSQSDATQPIANALAPDAQQESLVHAQEAAPIAPLSNADRPDEVSDAVWERLKQRRRMQIELEAHEQSLATVVQEMAAHSGDLRRAQMALQEHLVALKQERQKAVITQKLSAINTDIMLRAKQGQVEVDQKPVVTDLQPILLIPRGIVEQLNKEVLLRGNDKVDELRKITNFRKGITQLQWELDLNTLEHQDAVDLTTQLQLLRVTRNLQSLIKMGGQDHQTAEEIANLERKVEYLSHVTQEKVLNNRLKLMQLQKRIRQQAAENQALLEVSAELTEAVHERRQINKLKEHKADALSEQKRPRRAQSQAQQLRSAAKAPSRARPSTSLNSHQKQRMRSITTRRKLMELAKLQGEEISMLRREVERLRQRTFASFSAMGGGMPLDVPPTPPRASSAIHPGRRRSGRLSKPPSRARTAAMRRRRQADFVAGPRSAARVRPSPPDLT